MILKQLDQQAHYIPVPAPPALVAQEVFLAGIGQTDGMLPLPPKGCFLLAVPAAVKMGTTPLQGILLGSGAQSMPRLGSEYIYAVLGGRLAEAFLTPVLEEQEGMVPAIAAAELARLLRQSKNEIELGLALGGCRGSGIAYQLVMELVRANEEAPRRPSLVEQAIALMEENFAHLYGVEELAQSLEVSKSHLIRVFSAAMGMTPGQYLTQIRIERVKLLLQAGGYSHEAVAAMTGFSGANYLCKVFRKQTGITPGQYVQLVGGSKQDSEELRQLEQLEEILYL